MDNYILKATDLSVAFPTRQGMLHAVRNVDFSIEAGKTLGIVGESGCGKSVLAAAIMRLNPPQAKTSGKIFFNGKDIALLAENCKEMNRLRGGKLAMIFQEPSRALFPMKTIGAHLMECILLHGEQNRIKAKKFALELLDLVGINEAELRFKDYPHQFSGGMAQRVMIAMALAGDPQVLIADEPTTALDVTIQAQVLRLLKDIQKRNGMSILFISHDMSVIAQMSDDVMVMYLGKIVERSPVRKLFTQPLHPYSKALIGSIPSIDKKAERLDAIEGSVPKPIGELSGCAFAQRCKYAMPGICDTLTPTEINIETHMVACHLYTEQGGTRK